MKSLSGNVVVVDDDSEMQSLLRDFLTNVGLNVTTFSLATEALQFICGGKQGEGQGESPGESESWISVDLVISDLKMPKMDGLDFVEAVKKQRSDIPVILITAFGSIETAIEAMRRGAYDYIVKPFKLAEIGATVERALEYGNLKRDNSYLRREVKRTWSFGDIIGKSQPMRAIFDIVNRVAQTNANILITGESGTGKEMVARAIHSLSPRANKPFVAINCTTIPEALLESELFGHAKGAFTGAIQSKRGLFEEAEGGTFFLDEIGDMNVHLQAKLLRVLQERKIRPVGQNVLRDIDVRIIAATHKDLKGSIKEGRFREDLFYRLSVIPIVLPPLRQRREDIPVLAEHFLHKFAASHGSNVKGFSSRAMKRLMELRWEGNVRELENAVERAVVLAMGPLIEEHDLPMSEHSGGDVLAMTSASEFPTLETLERRYIQMVLEHTGGKKDKAAQILGINRRTLYRKELEFGHSPKPHPDDEPLDFAP